MIKRLLLVLALGAAFAACSPANSSTSPDVVDPDHRGPGVDGPKHRCLALAVVDDRGAPWRARPRLL